MVAVEEATRAPMVPLQRPLRCMRVVASPLPVNRSCARRASWQIDPGCSTLLRPSMQAWPRVYLRAVERTMRCNGARRATARVRCMLSFGDPRSTRSTEGRGWVRAGGGTNATRTATTATRRRRSGGRSSPARRDRAYGRPIDCTICGSLTMASAFAALSVRPSPGLPIRPARLRRGRGTTVTTTTTGRRCWPDSP